MKTILLLIAGAIIWQIITTIIYFVSGEEVERTAGFALGLCFFVLYVWFRIVGTIQRWYYRKNYLFVNFFTNGAYDFSRAVHKNLLDRFVIRPERNDDVTTPYVVICSTCKDVPAKSKKVNRRNFTSHEHYLKTFLKKPRVWYEKYNNGR